MKTSEHIWDSLMVPKQKKFVSYLTSNSVQVSGSLGGQSATTDIKKEKEQKLGNNRIHPLT